MSLATTANDDSASVAGALARLTAFLKYHPHPTAQLELYAADDGDSDAQRYRHGAVQTAVVLPDSVLTPLLGLLASMATP